MGKRLEAEWGEGGAGGREGKKGADNEGSTVSCVDGLRIVSLRAKGLEGMERKKDAKRDTRTLHGISNQDPKPLTMQTNG